MSKSAHWTKEDLIRHQLKTGTCNLTESDFKKPGKESKYKNKKVYTDDGTFDSKKEYNRWLVLKDMQQRGEITSLMRQQKISITVNGNLICNYLPDFQYIQNGKAVCEDVKGMKTAIYRLKKKMMKFIMGIEILET